VNLKNPEEVKRSVENGEAKLVNTSALHSNIAVSYDINEIYLAYKEEENKLIPVYIIKVDIISSIGPLGNGTMVLEAIK
jgi:hypothetical protein